MAVRHGHNRLPRPPSIIRAPSMALSRFWGGWTERRLRTPRVVNIADLRELARRRLPQVVFDYIDGGADAELTLRANRRAYQRVSFNPRCGLGAEECDLSVDVVGSRLALPFILGPVGSSRIFFPQAECEAARAAGEAGSAYVLSTLSGCRLEDVREATPGPVWYQLYLVGDRGITEAAIARASAAGFSALVVTIDTPIAGMRERDIRNRSVDLLKPISWARLRAIPQLFFHPRWWAAFIADGGVMKLPNVVLRDGSSASYGDVATMLARSAPSWKDLEWIRQAWPGPLIVKGVHNCNDARRAVECGAAAVVVSNHGGRQLDGVAATLALLPKITDAISDRAEVLLDGGIRRGGDIVKALCLGARAVLIGRAYAYGLGAAGGQGVARAIDILRTDVIRTMTLLGCHHVSGLDRSFVTAPRHWFADPRRSSKTSRPD